MEKYYQSLLQYIHQNPLLKKTIIYICQYFPYITFGLYPCILIYLFFVNKDLLLITIIKPKKGESFPSRHAVSAMIIALVCFGINIYLGIFALVIALLICISRIMAGVHYISDVFVSIIIAFMIYMI